jgi:hypothetical protein
VECVIAKAKLLQDHLFSKGVGEEEMNGGTRAPRWDVPSLSTMTSFKKGKSKIG